MAIRTLVLSAALALCGSTLMAGEEAKKASDAVVAQVKADIQKAAGMNDAVKAFVVATLLPQSTNSVLVAEVAKQNAKKTTLEAIQKIDKEWAAAEEPLPIQTEMTTNATAVELKKIAATAPAITEVFVMDNQGANVGQNELTSDYWQGDEEKWTNSFNKGAGGIDVGKEKFDKSANAAIQQISLPIIDADGKVIGAVTWGLNLSKLK